MWFEPDNLTLNDNSGRVREDENSSNCSGSCDLFLINKIIGLVTKLIYCFQLMLTGTSLSM